MLAELGSVLKWFSPFKRTYIMYQATESLDYIAHPNAFLWGGFEIVCAQLSPGFRAAARSTPSSTRPRSSAGNRPAKEVVKHRTVNSAALSVVRSSTRRYLHVIRTIHMEEVRHHVYPVLTSSVLEVRRRRRRGRRPWRPAPRAQPRRRRRPASAQRRAEPPRRRPKWCASCWIHGRWAKCPSTRSPASSTNPIPASPFSCSPRSRAGTPR